MSDIKLKLINEYKADIRKCNECASFAAIKNIPRTPDFADFTENYQLGIIQNYPRANDDNGPFRLNEDVLDEDLHRDEKTVRKLLNLVNIEKSHVYGTFILKCPVVKGFSVTACRNCVIKYLSKELNQSIRNWIIFTKNALYVDTFKRYIVGNFSGRVIVDSEICYYEHYRWKGKIRRYIFAINPTAIKLGKVSEVRWLDQVSNAILR